MERSKNNNQLIEAIIRESMRYESIAWEKRIYVLRLHCLHLFDRERGIIRCQQKKE